MAELNLMDRYPRTPRAIDARAELKTEEDQTIARQFGWDFFDGDRRRGYGGYYYHPRFWQETVKRFQDHYQLAEDASVLDVGCGKGFMLHDFKELMPKLIVAGLDISQYAIDNTIETMKPFVQMGDAKELPYEDNSFDLVISINTIHNLVREECEQAVREIQRVSRSHAFLTVDAWRNEDERGRMVAWNLTALTYMHAKEWDRLFAEVGYTGDFYWFIAE